MNSMILTKSFEQHVTCTIQDVVEKKLPITWEVSLVRSYVLGCDTKSSINRLRKTQILGKESRIPELRNLSDKWYKMTTQSVLLSERLLCVLSKYFFFHRLVIYVHHYLNFENRFIMNIISRKRSTIDPSYLLPSPIAFCFHGMRVFHQILVWRRLVYNDFKSYTLWVGAGKGKT